MLPLTVSCMSKGLFVAFFTLSALQASLVMLQMLHTKPVLIQINLHENTHPTVRRRGLPVSPNKGNGSVR